MNIDFHYYATYLAARIAGYDKPEGEKIAYIAQYVDEADEDIAKLAKKRGIEGAIFTTQGKWDSAMSWAVTNRKCWVPFHFLPGNINLTEAYNGKPLDSDEKKDSFRLMCLPKSELSTYMIQDSVANSDNLTLTGIRMHVLADTWAHAYFSGTTISQVNDVDWKIDERVAGRWESHKIAPGASPFDSSVVYLGHVQVRHAPDNGYLNYRFRPKWRSRLGEQDRYIERNNPEIFAQALKQMIEALQCIRQGVKYTLDLPSGIGEGIYQTILDTFRRVPDGDTVCYDERSQAGFIRDLIDYFGFELPVDFNRNQLQTDMPEFRRFFDSANRHFEFVKMYLNLNKISLLND